MSEWDFNLVFLFKNKRIKSTYAGSHDIWSLLIFARKNINLDLGLKVIEVALRRQIPPNIRWGTLRVKQKQQQLEYSLEVEQRRHFEALVMVRANL